MAELSRPDQIPALKAIWAASFPEDSPELIDRAFGRLYRPADCMVAVSYTHLDVYKRQLLYRERYIVQCFDRCVALAVYLGQMLHTKNFHDCLPLGYPAPPDAPGLLRGCPRHAFSIRRRGDGPVTASVTVLSHDGFVKTQGEPAAPFGGALRKDFAVLPG